MQLNDEQRKLWADKLMDLANIGAGILIFGQILAPTSVGLFLVVGAIVGYALVLAIATRFLRK